MTWVAPGLEFVDEVVVDDVVVDVLVSAVVAVVVVVVLVLSSTTPDEDLLAVQSKGQHQPSEQPLRGSAIAISTPVRINIFFMIFPSTNFHLQKGTLRFNVLIITWRRKTLLRDFLINVTVITWEVKTLYL